MLFRIFYSFLSALIVIAIVKILLPKPPPNYRLSNAIKPYEYNITLQPFLHARDGVKQFTFSGEVFIKFQALKLQLKSIELHAKKLKILRVELRDDKGLKVQQIESEFTKYEAETDKLSLSLLNTLIWQTNYSLFIRYTGKISEDLEGVFRFQHDNRARHVAVLWLKILN